MGYIQDSEVYVPLARTFSTNNCYFHFFCQLLMLLVSLWSFLGQILNTLPLSQRWEINEVHFLIRRRIWEKQKHLGPISAILLFNGSNMVYLKIISQISLVFLLFSPYLFLILFSSCLFFQSFSFHNFCLSLGLTLKLFLFFLLAK